MARAVVVRTLRPDAFDDRRSPAVGRVALAAHPGALDAFEAEDLRGAVGLLEEPLRHLPNSLRPGFVDPLPRPGT